MGYGDSLRDLTWFGGQYWIVLDLTVIERLALNHIPACENPDRINFWSPSTEAPLKTMHAVCESLGASGWIRGHLALGQASVGLRKRRATRVVETTI